MKKITWPAVLCAALILALVPMAASASTVDHPAKVVKKAELSTEPCLAELNTGPVAQPVDAARFKEMQVESREQLATLNETGVVVAKHEAGAVVQNSKAEAEPAVRVDLTALTSDEVKSLDGSGTQLPTAANSETLSALAAGLVRAPSALLAVDSTLNMDWQQGRAPDLGQSSSTFAAVSPHACAVANWC